MGEVMEKMDGETVKRIKNKKGKHKRDEGKREMKKAIQN